MLPIDIPADATLRSLVTEIVPEAHAKLVPPSAGDEAFTLVAAIEGEGSFTLDVRGARMEVREEESRARHLWLLAYADVAERFLEDWTGAQRFVPKFAPPSDVKLMTDPRVLRRLVMASGKVELALTDFEGERVAMTVAFGAAAKKTIDPDDPDVVVEAPVAVLEEILRGALSPEDALAEGRVTVKGKRLLAMQLALALAPLAAVKR